MSNVKSGSDQEQKTFPAAKPLAFKVMLGDLVLVELPAMKLAEQVGDALGQLAKVINLKPEDLLRALRSPAGRPARTRAEAAQDLPRDTPGETYCDCPACELRRLIKLAGLR